MTAIDFRARAIELGDRVMNITQYADLSDFIVRRNAVIEAALRSVAEEATRAERERCAQLIREYQEAISETSAGTVRRVEPRKPGNLLGLAFAAAIASKEG